MCVSDSVSNERKPGTLCRQVKSSIQLNPAQRGNARGLSYGTVIAYPFEHAAFVCGCLKPQTHHAAIAFCLSVRSSLTHSGSISFGR